MAGKEQVEVWKEQVTEYKKWYESEYGHRPGEQCLASFCSINKIPWPIPKPEIEFDFLQ